MTHFYEISGEIVIVTGGVCLASMMLFFLLSIAIECAVKVTKNSTMIIEWWWHRKEFKRWLSAREAAATGSEARK